MVSRKHSSNDQKPQHRRGAIGWLEEVAAESSSAAARKAAQEDVAAWDSLVESWKRRSLQTRRSLADILAGIGAKKGEGTTTIHCGKRTFVFHVWAEARARRELPALASALEANVPMPERVAQKGRWGRKLRT